MNEINSKNTKKEREAHKDKLLIYYIEVKKNGISVHP